ncbi:Alpha/Beta hydrolase protein [Mycena galopus ATCC 62051]|nr:Alpha/Beta hydrolase protein [Mycena galopus ATCC 62051]
MSLPVRKYGQVNWAESVGILAAERSIKRIIGDSALRHILRLGVPQLQVVFGTTAGTYDKWCKAAKLEKTVDQLEQDAKLLWIGPKRLERVVLYFHGGGFLLPPVPLIMLLCRYVQLELEKQNIEVGFALLEYSLGPQASFPTPLKQAALALDFLMAAGVKPQNLQLVGDSAGGNLILQVLSQMLHPRDGVPEIRLPGPLRGIYLISPWTNLSVDSKSHFENDGRDWLHPAGIKDWGTQILAGVPKVDRPFAEPVRAPAGWFKGADALVDRMLVTAGGAELLRDDIIAFAEAFEKHHANVKLVVQKGGMHEDILLDFLVKDEKTSTLTSLTVEWLAAGFEAEPSV